MELRLPRWMRIWEVMFAAGWIGIGAVNVVAMVSEGAWGVAPFGVAFVGAGSWFIVRSTRLAVIADDELIVRNHHRTRRFPRSRVDAFRIGSPGMAMPFGPHHQPPRRRYEQCGRDTVLVIDTCCPQPGRPLGL